MRGRFGQLKFNSKIVGVKQINAKLGARITAHSKQSLLNVKTATLLIHSEAVKNLQRVSPGETETRYGPKRTVKVSKPGDSPNTDTGTAIKNIGFNVDEQKNKGEVGTNLKYLKFLELGTKFIAARPWLITALKKVQPDIRKVFRKIPKVR